MHICTYIYILRNFLLRHNFFLYSDHLCSSLYIPRSQLQFSWLWLIPGYFGLSFRNFPLKQQTPNDINIHMLLIHRCVFKYHVLEGECLSQIRVMCVLSHGSTPTRSRNESSGTQFRMKQLNGFQVREEWANNRTEMYLGTPEPSSTEVLSGLAQLFLPPNSYCG